MVLQGPKSVTSLQRVQEVISSGRRPLMNRRVPLRTATNVASDIAPGARQPVTLVATPGDPCQLDTASSTSASTSSPALPRPGPSGSAWPHGRRRRRDPPRCRPGEPGVIDVRTVGGRLGHGQPWTTLNTNAAFGPERTEPPPTTWPRSSTTQTTRRAEHHAATSRGAPKRAPPRLLRSPRLGRPAAGDVDQRRYRHDRGHHCEGSEGAAPCHQATR